MVVISMTLGEARRHAIEVLERAERRRIAAAAAESNECLAREVAEYIRSHPITDWNAWAEKLAADSCSPGALGGP